MRLHLLFALRAGNQTFGANGKPNPPAIPPSFRMMLFWYGHDIFVSRIKPKLYSIFFWTFVNRRKKCKVKNAKFKVI